MLLGCVEDFRGTGTSLLPGPLGEWREESEREAGGWFCVHCFLILFSLVLPLPSAAMCSLVYDTLHVLGL